MDITFAAIALMGGALTAGLLLVARSLGQALAPAAVPVRSDDVTDQRR